MNLSQPTRLEQGIALVAPEQQHDLAVRYGVAPGVQCLAFMAWALWSLGYPDQALRRSHEACTLAQELPHAHSLAVALYYAARLHQYRREVQAARDQAEATISLTTGQGLSYYLALGRFLRGWTVALQGQGEDGVAQMSQAMVATLATGANLLRPLFYTLLAEAYAKVGQAGEGLRLLSEALTAQGERKPRYYEAETYRLKGELLLKQTVPDEQQAEACLHQALSIAHQQQAKSLELRAATSLARLWQSQGKRQDAYDLLAAVYEWFTEGFDTADLREAQALLEELRY